MDKEQLISSIKELLENEEKYSVMRFFKKNIGAFITAVSLVAALMVFAAKTCSYLIDGISCRYWNLDERFIVEDNKAYLKLGVYICIFAIITLSNVIAKRYTDLWELHDCQFYLLARLDKLQKKKIKSLKKRIKVIGKGINVAERVLKDHANYPLTENDVVLKERFEQLKRDIKSSQIENRKLLPLKLKWKSIHIWYLGESFFISIIASLILQIFFGQNVGDFGLIRIIKWSLILALNMMAGVLLTSWVDIKLKFRLTLNSFLKVKEDIIDSECKMQIMNLLESKADRIQNRDMKEYFSDKSCKKMTINFILYVVATIILLPIIAQYNLYHLDTFYIVKEDMQNYVVVANDGNNFVLSQCDVFGDDLIVDTNKIYVTKESIKMEKRVFKKVEKRGE